MSAKAGLQHDIAACAALQIVFDDVSDGVTRVVTAIDLTVAITQAVCIQLDNASETGVVLRRQDQMEIAFQPIRRYRLQVKMQGVAAIKTSRLGNSSSCPNQAISTSGRSPLSSGRTSTRTAPSTGWCRRMVSSWRAKILALRASSARH